MAAGSAPAHVPFDTSGAGSATNPNTYVPPVAFKADNAETGGPQGGYQAPPAPVPVGSPTKAGPPATTGTPDTSIPPGPGVPYVPTPPPGITGTVNTLNPGGGAGVVEANPAYRAPGLPPSATIRDTTLTDVQPGGSTTNPVPTSLNASNLDPYSIGAGAFAPVDLNVPVQVPGTPTVVAGPRLVTVSWTAVADPAGDKVKEYIIEFDRGGEAQAAYAAGVPYPDRIGRQVAPANATSDTINFLDPSEYVQYKPDNSAGVSVLYKFRVAARNNAGTGPFSAWSAAVRPYNPDASGPRLDGTVGTGASKDPLLPAGVTPFNATAGIYKPDGTLVTGTGLASAPTIGAATAQAAKKVTVNWTAPASGVAATSYLLTPTAGSTLAPTTFTAAAGATSLQVTFTTATVGAGVTFKVQAVNSFGVAGPASAASNSVTILA